MAQDKKETPKKVVAKKTTQESAPDVEKRKGFPGKRRKKGEKKPNILKRIGGYFKGAWLELRQVRWPSRKQTWSLTLAVLLFSVLFGAMIFLIDALFVWIFNKVIF